MPPTIKIHTNKYC